MMFASNKICNEFDDFISNSILERDANGSLSTWMKKDECEPPHSVMLITIEPSKPRMCHDERFLNLWMKAPSISFDRLMDIPRYVEQNHFQTKFDDKSGYDHVMLSEESRTFFGICWKGWFFVYNILPFGWSQSAYIYHTIGLGPLHFVRSKGVSLSQYIDDRHLGQMRPPKCHPFIWSNLDLARAASFIATLVLVSCGYFTDLKKSVFDLVQSIMFLGFISDSVKQAFILPDEKKKRFATLRDSLIGMELIPIKSLQKFAGKVVSFSLPIPAAMLFYREVNFHIGKSLRSSKPVRMSKNLKNELEYWNFVDSWEAFCLGNKKDTLQ